MIAQPNVYERLTFPENIEVANVRTPRQFLGYRLGERFTEYARSVEYFDYLAEASPRIKVERYGSTYEGRPLLLLTVSDDNNMSRLEEIRSRQLELVNGFRGAGSQVETIAAQQPVINSFSYNIHGNEASSTEAAMQVAYELATSQDAEVLDALRNSIVLMFVCINPDGRDRYVYWYNGMARMTGGEEPRDLEHYAPWPNGRTNHYWFDLNRDWIWGVHPESRGHTQEYQRWMPSVHTDYHEQGYDANYFTVPGTTPRNLLLPDAYEVWADTFGRANIAQFDRKGISYFTRDRFDFFYPSYGSSYPSVMGAIGMLTEQGGIAGGRAVETEDGFVLTLRQRVWDHYTTSIAQIKAAARNRRELIDYSLAAWNPLNSKHAATAYLIENDGSDYFNDFLRVMLLNGVEVERTTEGFSGSGRSYRDSGRSVNRNFPTGSLVISTEQARHLFVNSLLSPQLEIEDSVMYDMSTWSAPLAYNLEAYSFEGPVQVATEPVTEVRMRGAMNGGNEGDAYAYVINWNQRLAPRALAELWRADLRVRVARTPFTDDTGKTFPAGSLIVLRGRNLDKEAKLRGAMQRLVLEGITVDRFATGRMADGNDLASTRNFPVKPPKAAMLVEPPFNTYTSGQIYFLFDQETRLPVERIRASILRQTALPKLGSRYGYADLNDYDVLILPDGGNLKAVFGKEELEQLKSWLSAGGTLVAVGSSAEYFTSESEFLNQAVDKAGRDTSVAAKTLDYAERTDYYGKQRVPGTALNATLDTTHPLAFGLKESVYTLKFGSNSLVPDAGLQSVGRYAAEAEELLAAGYINEANLARLAGKTWAGVRNVGQGKVVYLMDNPHYRMFWRGPSRLMQNAVMVVPGS